MQKIEYPRVGLVDVMRVIWKGIRPQAGVFFAVATAFTADRIIASVFILLYYKDFFDVLTEAKNPATAGPILISIVVTIGLLNAFRFVMRRVADFGVASLETNTMSRLRQMSFEYLIRHSYGFFANNFTGSLVQRVSRLARSLERLVDTLLFNFIPLVVTVGAAILVTWHTERTLSYIIVAWVVVFSFCNFIFSLWRVRYSVKVAEADSKTTGTLADIIANQNAVSIFATFPAERERFKKVTNSQASITRFTWNLAALFDAAQASIILVAEFFLFYFGVHLWQEGAVTVGTLVLVQVYFVQLSSQLWDFGRIIRTLYESYADSKEMVEILTLPHEIQDAPDATVLLVPKGEIRFESVVFNFLENRKIFDGLSLGIPAGQKCALVGQSGAGKTTIARLLLRLHDVTGGKILIDGQDIRHVTLDSLHENIAMVPQDPVLFHRSLMENIRYGRLTATDEEVKRAASLAHCDEFIDILPLKYETFVGERGVKLSGGERQRIAIARAILKNAPILILDEATSSLDSHSEALIQDALDTLMKGKTAIMVAHRLSTIRKMDRIVVLENGAIREDGTHDSLLENPGSLYRQLWSLQAGGFIGADE